MKRLIVAIAALTCAIAAFAQPKDWAKFSEYEEANKEVTGQEINAVLMGDSITYLWMERDPDFFSTHNFVGRGISGQTTSEMLVRFRRDVIDLNPKAVIILAGINDIAMNNGIISLENAAGNSISMCELAMAHKIKPILCSVLPCDRLSWRPEVAPAEKVVELNKLLKEYADANKLTYVDYWTAMNNGQGGLDPSISKDGCHPETEGFKMMENVLLEATSKYFKFK